MLNVKKLQAIRDKILGVTVDYSKYGDLNSVVYLQQILDAVNGVTSTPARVRGNLHEIIYLQKIRNAKLGVVDGQFGSLSSSIYLQQIINAFNGVTSTKYGSLSENTYLDLWVSVAAGTTVVPWYLAGGILLANCVAAYKPMGAATLAASYINLVNPGTNNAAPGIAPLWDAANGWQFDGAAQYLTTGIVPGNQWTIAVRFSNLVNPPTVAYFAGSSDGANSIVLGATNGTNTRRYRNGVTAKTGGVIDPSGVIIMAGDKGYYNGVQDVTGLGGNGGNAFGLFVGGIDANGALSQVMNSYVLALAVYNAAITPTQAAALSTAMSALTP